MRWPEAWKTEIYRQIYCRLHTVIKGYHGVHSSEVSHIWKPPPSERRRPLVPGLKLPDRLGRHPTNAPSLRRIS
ncbi:hypothetical protein PAL_GLEAN10017062 [Pteropus alecto]|uniref:Uncharacterized protein n=1 Tax=Pteropus alecto TaxID=9402 RepID=L5JUW9_PTEAL|nr:hypothetical protein PAL_GLEAN10017062 [Pteropus alecto]